MRSSIKLIADQKTSHLRELIVKQKVNIKRRRSRSSSKKYFSSTSYKYDLPKSSNKSKFVNAKNYSSHNYNTSRVHLDIKTLENSNNAYVNARGYDYIRKKSVENLKLKGIVTIELREGIENLCTSSSKVNFNKQHITLNYKMIIIFHNLVSGRKYFYIEGIFNMSS